MKCSVFHVVGELIKRWGRVPFLPGQSPPPAVVSWFCYSLILHLACCMGADDIFATLYYFFSQKEVFFM